MPLIFSTSACYESIVVWGDSFARAFLDQGGLPLGHPTEYLSFLYAFIPFRCQSVVDGGVFFKTKIWLCHLSQGFFILVFFKCCLECVEVYFHLRTFSEYSQLCFRVVYPFSFFVMIFLSPHLASKFFFTSFTSVYWYDFAHSPLLVGRIFFRCFG